MASPGLANRLSFGGSDLSFGRRPWFGTEIVPTIETGAPAHDVPLSAWVHARGAARAAFLIAMVALIDWRVDLNIAFGFLYLFPILLVGTVLPRWQILLTALVCTLLVRCVRSRFPSRSPWRCRRTSWCSRRWRARDCSRTKSPAAGAGKWKTCAGWKRKSAARRAAEEQLEFLIDSSPAAILTMASDCLILRANPAAHRLLGSARRGIAGQKHPPLRAGTGPCAVSGETPQTFRTEMQCRGESETGDVFLANVFFSTYKRPWGRGSPRW